ncbi:protein takeout-like [Chrysoperla carnea]|uniref:protein takeout-like n=1 Tax=Chrysoperla carnea TaxID=189513 RepID=UPI001D091009|nr:protein takeout-like [Chrysoperla carnea]
MNSLLISMLSLLSFFNWNQATTLPDFITPCKGSDPNLNDCATIAANKAIPILVKGYPTLNIPVLSPLKIPQIKVENNGQLNIVLNDAIVRGLEESKVSNFNIDLKSNHLRFILNIPNLNIQAEYVMSGQLLVLPLSGKGPANVTASNGDYDIDIAYTLYEKNDIQYIKLEKVDVKLDIKGLQFHFDNLLNANKQISDDANAFLNKEWRQVLKDLEPALKEAIEVIVLQVANGIVDKVPYLEIYGGEVP